LAPARPSELALTERHRSVCTCGDEALLGDPSLANLQAWFARVSSRPAVKSEIAWLMTAQAKL